MPEKMQPVRLEICCGDLASVAAAAEGGADRVELCSGLAEGGMTPSAGFVREAIAMAGGRIGIHVLLRPRPGDFIYSPGEARQILADTEFLVGESPGPDGIVFGALTPEGDVDTELCAAVARMAQGKSLTFHRAFDLCRNPEKALEEIISLGYDRILTSGCAASALEGTATLHRLGGLAAGRIILLAGAGVTAGNAAEIVRLGGVRELHASARRPVGSAMRFRKAGVAMGTPGSDEYTRLTTGAGEVRAIRQAVEQLLKTKRYFAL